MHANMHAYATGVTADGTFPHTSGANHGGGNAATGFNAAAMGLSRLQAPASQYQLSLSSRSLTSATASSDAMSPLMTTSATTHSRSFTNSRLGQMRPFEMSNFLFSDVRTPLPTPFSQSSAWSGSPTGDISAATPGPGLAGSSNNVTRNQDAFRNIDLRLQQRRYYERKDQECRDSQQCAAAIPDVEGMHAAHVNGTGTGGGGGSGYSNSFPPVLEGDTDAATTDTVTTSSTNSTHTSDASSTATVVFTESSSDAESTSTSAASAVVPVTDLDLDTALVNANAVASEPTGSPTTATAFASATTTTPSVPATIPNNNNRHPAFSLLPPEPLAGLNTLTETQTPVTPTVAAGQAAIGFRSNSQVSVGRLAGGSNASVLLATSAEEGNGDSEEDSPDAADLRRRRQQHRAREKEKEQAKLRDSDQGGASAQSPRPTAVTSDAISGSEGGGNASEFDEEVDSVDFLLGTDDEATSPEASMHGQTEASINAVIGTAGVPDLHTPMHQSGHFDGGHSYISPEHSSSLHSSSHHSSLQLFGPSLSATSANVSSYSSGGLQPVLLPTLSRFGTFATDPDPPGSIAFSGVHSHSNASGSTHSTAAANGKPNDTSNGNSSARNGSFDIPPTSPGNDAQMRSNSHSGSPIQLSPNTHAGLISSTSPLPGASALTATGIAGVPPAEWLQYGITNILAGPVIHRSVSRLNSDDGSVAVGHTSLSLPSTNQSPLVGPTDAFEIDITAAAPPPFPAIQYVQSPGSPPTPTKRLNSGPMLPPLPHTPNSAPRIDVTTHPLQLTEPSAFALSIPIAKPTNTSSMVQDSEEDERKSVRLEEHRKRREKREKRDKRDKRDKGDKRDSAGGDKRERREKRHHHAHHRPEIVPIRLFGAPTPVELPSNARSAAFSSTGSSSSSIGQTMVPGAIPLSLTTTTVTSGGSGSATKDTVQRSLFHGLRVLHVDDEAVNRRLMGRMLTILGAEYMCLTDGVQVEQVLIASGQLPPTSSFTREIVGSTYSVEPAILPGGGAPNSIQPFHVILLDLIMPQMDGATVASQLRKIWMQRCSNGTTGNQQPRLQPPAFVVAVTGNAKSIVPGSPMASYFDGVVEKPFTMLVLQNVLQKVLEKGNSHAP